MGGLRVLLYIHVVVTIVSTGLAVWDLDRYAASDWRSRRALAQLLEDPAARWTYNVLLLSSFAFPAAVAFKTVKRMSAWRWVPLLGADLILGFIQGLALSCVYPVRE